jgi:hypothetical protein
MADEGEDYDDEQAFQHSQPYDENLDQLVPLLACCCESSLFTEKLGVGRFLCDLSMNSTTLRHIETLIAHRCLLKI